MPEHAADGDPGIELTAGGDRLLHEPPIEIAAQDRAAPLPLGISPLDSDAAFAGDHHPVDPQAASFNPVRDAERAQPRKRAGIDRVAAQLVPRKRRAIHNPHAQAAAGEHDSRDGARRSGADDQHINHLVIGESGNREIDWVIIGELAVQSSNPLPDHSMTQ